MPILARPTRGVSRSAIRSAARVAYVVARDLVHADVYASVGIDPAVGREAALANPHWQGTLRWSARKLVPFLREQGII